MIRARYRLVLSCLVASIIGWMTPHPAYAQGAGGDSQANAKVVLHLRWMPQFQFAGYYAALWKGFYAEAGLDVDIRPPHDEEGRYHPPTDAVAGGRAQFGVGSSDILLARDQGADLVVLMSIFQTSPATLYVRHEAPFRTLADLRAMRVLRLPGDALDIEFRAMLLAQDIDPSVVTYVGSIDDPFDAMMGYSVSAPFLLDTLGVETFTVRPRDYGVNFYGDSLFTTADVINDDPEMVEAFVAASRRGWEYALRHPHEIARGLASAFPPPRLGVDLLAYNRAQIDEVLELTGHPVVEPGHINPDRWQRMNETLQRLGMVGTPLDTSTFIYEEVRSRVEREASIRRSLLWVVGVVAVLALSSAVGAIVMREVLRRRARALERVEESYRILVDNLRDYAILGLDPEGRMTSWNRGAERLTGFSREEVIGRHVSILFPSSDAESGLPQREIEQAAQFGRIEVEGMRARRDGTPYWANVVLSALRGHEGELLGYAVVIRDASQRKAAEDRIRFQATLLNRVRSAVIAVSEEGRVTYMNAYAEALFLLPWREAENRPLHELAILPDEALTPLALRARSEQEVTAHRRDGQGFPALLIASVAADQAGRAHSAVYVIHDLTERKRMEATLQHSSNLALLGRMSASLVHEISQPMNVIRLTAEGGLLRLAGRGVDTDDLSHRFRTISEQAARLFDTIDFMQTFSRRDAGRVNGLAGPPFDLAEAVRKAAEMMVERFEAAGIGLQLDLPPGVYMARGRTRQFEQVLLNLMGNALHALRLRADQPDRLVRARLDVPDRLPGSLVLTVEDNGPGVPGHLRDQIFEPFFTTKPPGQGTGLGLSISLGIIRSMDGTMTVGESTDLGGAAFTLTLPADHLAPSGEGAGTEALVAASAPRRLPPAAAPAAAPVEQPSAGQPHVLVVDDEELARREVGDYLAAHGYQVSQASGGIEALGIVARCNGDGTEGAEGGGDGGEPPVDVVVTDIRMPRGSGTELIARLAEDYPQVFTIVMTGQPLSDREDLEDIGSGADAVMRKPISLSEIEGRLRELLSQADQDG